MTAMDELRQISAEITQLNNILALLHWDQEVMMPVQATRDRANQIATLGNIIHQKTISPQVQKIVAEVEERQERLSEHEQALLRVMRRELAQSLKLPAAFVMEFSQLTSQALPVWAAARKKSDFSLFEPILESICAMCRQKAEFLGYAEVPYDALLDLHEEGLLSSQVDALFARLKPELVALIRKAADHKGTERLAVSGLDEKEQERFSCRLLEKIGYDFARGRQDKSAHPFSTSLGHHDRRITNRYHPSSFEFIFSALHEGGHGLYEQGVAEELADLHLDTGVSLGIHESQSRLWENIIGRSLPFWRYFYPEAQKAFPAMLSQVPVESFYREINTVRPDYIRVEADEVSYNLHVLIRFELEKALFDGGIAVHDLPGLWREKYSSSLGVFFADLPDADAKGVLQDIHWAHGSFGYFPTYTIGNLAAAQFWQAYCRFDPDYEQTIAAGDFTKIRKWLVDNIYRHGAVYPPGDLLQRVTGAPLSEKYFVEYLQNKFGSR
jgi:carboxypeptidase Taq